MKELHSLSKLSQTGLEVALDIYLQHKDEVSTELLADSLALAMRQAFYLNKELLILAIGTEMDNAHSEVKSIVKRGQLELF